MRHNIIFATSILTLFICYCQNPSNSKKEKSNLCPYTTALSLSARLVPDKVPEPSGIVFHGDRKTLFVVGDQGDIAEMQTNGKTVKKKHMGEFDLEGITCDPSTGYLYVVIENASTIFEIDPTSFSMLRKFKLDWRLNGTLTLNPKKEHLEGITFVPDSLHQEGGTFYVVNRSAHPEDSERPSAIFEIELPLNTDINYKATGKVINQINMTIPGLSGILYAPEQNGFYLVSDDKNMMFKVNMSGETEKCYTLTGDKQEGIAIDFDNFFYIADDAGNAVLKFYDQY